MKPMRRVHRPAPFRPMPLARRGMRFTAAFLLAAIVEPPDSLGRTLAITCEDGSSRAIARAHGKREVYTSMPRFPVCDVDGACDGLCTFILEAGCIEWMLGPQRSEPPCGYLRDAPCPSYIHTNHFIVPLRRGRKARTAVRHLGRLTLVLRCRPAPRGCATTTVTTTTLPGVPNVTGYWTLTGTATGNCSPGLPSLPFAPEVLLVQQAGTQIRAGSDDACYNGTISSSGRSLIVESGHAVGGCSTSLYDLSSSVSASLPDSRGVISLSQHWNLTPEQPNPACPPCEIIWRGTMAIVTKPCVTHRECVKAFEPCSRCVGGICTRVDPLCR